MCNSKGANLEQCVECVNMNCVLNIKRIENLIDNNNFRSLKVIGKFKHPSRVPGLKGTLVCKVLINGDGMILPDYVVTDIINICNSKRSLRGKK